MPAVKERSEPVALIFRDDGLVPNNALPFLVYRGAINLDNAHPEREGGRSLFGDPRRYRRIRVATRGLM